MSRLLKHFFFPEILVARYFPERVLQEISEAIRVSEKTHGAEICFFVEGSLPLGKIVRGVSARQRAEELFGDLRVWDTEHNVGILIYALIAERDIEILVDRGISKVVTPQQIEQACRTIESHFREGRYREGVIAGVDELGAAVRPHIARTSGDEDELSNAPRLSR